MGDNSWKSIRNATIASTIAGIIVLIVPIFRVYVVSFFSWLWSGVGLVWDALVASYSLPGWAWLIFVASSLFGFVTMYLAMRSGSTLTEYEYESYFEDTFYGAKWRWHWIDHQIANVWCYCPCCDATLVYIDYGLRHYRENKTDFICENCNNKVVASIEGGSHYYAIDAVKREIGRRIRTNEYKNHL